MNKINGLIKQMGELAEEILELQAEGRGGSDLIHLYDRADTVFSAGNVKALLQNNDALIATIEMQDQKIQKLELQQAETGEQEFVAIEWRDEKTGHWKRLKNQRSG
ncbi:hypothetical protein [Pectobacterium odoriferum]|uniref:hypothetical protein n=1 Tax=Pectobacterium odoriferum TaxID=78398 RepID=UPI000CD265D7|nr:hypothetical protein [Pectobacterium odoriferum]POD98057.1 hypothetical protein BVY05_20170 [Pectobacterium odoriferum]